MLLLIAFALLAGAGTALSPCVLPLVPGYVAWVAGTDLATARAERLRALRLAAFFVLGFGLVFVLLGLGATAVGGLLRRWSYELMVAGGLLIAALGLVQAGLLRVAPLMRDLRFRSMIIRLDGDLAGGRPAGRRHGLRGGGITLLLGRPVDLHRHRLRVGHRRNRAQVGRRRGSRAGNLTGLRLVAGGTR